MSTPADTLHPNPAVATRLAHLYGLARNRAVDLGFRPPYLRLLRALGDPHLHLPPVVHIAGTNGKGSTLAFLRAALEAHGYAVHAYTSPHLVRFNERIVLKNKTIHDDTILTLFDRVMAANAGAALTFFEATTALAFLAFAQTPSDVVLLETGMGGRLDCTNVVPRPAACVITAIALDHAEHLGDTLEAIAREKAGIMKPGVPCVVARQEAANVVNPVLIETAARVEAPLHLHGRDWQDTAQDVPALPGDHQRDNAATARQTLLTLSDTLKTDSDTIRSAIAQTTWPARLQKLDIKWVPSGWSVWLDGGHNLAAAQALAAWVTHEDTLLHLIVGMKADKDAPGFLAPLAPCATSIQYATLPGPHHAFPGMRPWDDALRHIVTHHDPPARVLITGSLYLAGEVLRSCPQP